MEAPNEHDRGPLEKLPEGEFMRLFIKHEPALRAFARSILPDWHLVDDTLQEASVTMWEKLGQLHDEAGFLP
ncbi:sigma factor, partial [Novipirellula sp.]|uniref:sigma factor n=1 Tax=Novipirellula sp. TaxID=2795430 RepID=UPI003565E174